MTLNVGMVISGNTSDAQREVAQLTQKTRQFGTTTDAANAEASRSFKQLKASIDPVYRAELELQRAQKILNQSVRAGITTQGEAVKIAAQLTARNNALAVSMTNVGRKSRKTGFQVQNASYQFADMAVQIDGGVDPMRAVGQQLPQLLGGFGALGAVLGLVAAVGVPLARMLFSTADAVEENIDPVERLTDAQNSASTSLQSYRQILAATAVDIRSEYGGMTEQVQAHVEALRILRKEQAYDEISDVLDQTFGSGVAGEFAQDVAIAEQRVAELRGRIAELAGQLSTSVEQKNMLLPPMRNELERISRLPDIAEKYNISPEAITRFLELRDAINEAVSAGDFETANENVAALREMLQGIPDGPLSDMIEGVLRAEDLLIKAGFAAGGIAPEISNAADQADRLAVALRNAQAESFLYSRRFADEEALMNMPLTVDPRNRPSSTPPRRTGGGGQASSTDKQATALKKLTDGLQLEIELLGELDPVNQEMLRLRGKLGEATAEETDMVRELIKIRNEEREQLDANIEKMDFMRDSFRSFLDIFRRDGDSSLTFLEKLWASLDNIGSKLTDLALNSLTDTLFGAGGSADGGAVGGFFANILGGLNLFADGDVFDSPTLFGFGNGQLGVMGEAGREGVVPLEHSFGSGIGVKIGNRETALPLTRLNSGKLGASLQPFAKGGAFGGIVPVQTITANSGISAANSGAPVRGGVTNNYWSIKTDNPKTFAESRATTARAASRLMGGLGRHS